VNWYDFAEEYDVLCSWDPAAERDFVLEASERYGIASPRRVLEPFCGSGRLLRAMPVPAVGFDWNPNMVRFARRRGCHVFRADAARFAVRAGGFDLAYCLIDSFRHLLTEEAAHAHLRGVARALRPGGIYVLGFDVTGDLGGDVSGDTWGMERQGVRVDGNVRCLGDADPTTRVETMHVRLSIRGGARRRRVESFQPLRIYARNDVHALLAAEGSFEIAAAFDRFYDFDHPVSLAEMAGSVVLILRAARRGT